MMLEDAFFDRPACTVARTLLGKVLRRWIGDTWLSVQIIETEAYEIREKGSHASLGRTPSREALFMPAGTLYLYHSRAGDSLNVSCRGDGNAVLLKSGYPFFDGLSPPESSLSLMQRNNPPGHPYAPQVEAPARPRHRLCNGQALLCRSLELRVADWNRRRFCRETFFVEDVGIVVGPVIRARRLGIPRGRNEELLYRFLDPGMARFATQDPRRKRDWLEGRDYLEDD